VVFVAGALTWRLGRALTVLHPRPRTWKGRLVAPTVIVVALVSFVLQFTLGVFHVDPNKLFSQSTPGSRLASLILVLLIFLALGVAAVRYASKRVTDDGYPRRASLRLLTASLVPLIAVVATTFVLGFASARPSIPYAIVLSSVFYLVAVGIVLSVIMLLNETFVQWRQLSEADVKISRLLFRRWQAWVAVALTFGCFSVAIPVGFLPAGSARTVILEILGGLGFIGVLWSTPVAIMGFIFFVRVSNGIDEVRAKSVQPETREVVYERLLHDALVRLPLQSYMYGSERLIVTDESGDLFVGDGTPNLQLDDISTGDEKMTKSSGRTRKFTRGFGLAVGRIAARISVQRRIRSEQKPSI
jgi:hypothetical protein